MLVSKVHKPTLRALAFARATRPDVLTALTVNVDDADTRALQADWERYDIPVPLTVLESPYREITRPVLDYVKAIRRDSPRELVVVFVPQYVVGHWWENVLHNQSALRLRARLQFMPGVMITTVPWQLESSIGREDDRRLRPGAGRPAARADRRRRDHAVWMKDPAPHPSQARGGSRKAAAPARRRRQSVAAARGGGWTGREFEVTVGPVAHGGHCVARHEGRVVFVRHALPGERVVVRVTEDRHPGYCRADARRGARGLAGAGWSGPARTAARAGAAGATGSTSRRPSSAG